jgi:histidinol-phosphate aminotransferase
VDAGDAEHGWRAELLEELDDSLTTRWHYRTSRCRIAKVRPYDTSVPTDGASAADTLGARSALAALPEYAPPRATGKKPIVRLDANECALGPFPAARAALLAQLREAHRYPQRDGELIERLAARHALASSQVALGNGADGLIGQLSSALLEPGDEVLTAWPSFPTYVLDARKAGAVVTFAPLRDGAVDLDALAERIGSRTRLVWVCTPNNPTGRAVGRDHLARFLEVVPERVLVVIDEAYFEYAAGPDHADSLREHVGRSPHVGVLRTFSKIYGLASLRIGWFAGPAQIVRALGQVRHYYDVCEPANVAALASLADDAELERRRAANVVERERLAAGLRDLGIRTLVSQANFLAAEVGDGAALAARLLERGIAVRALDGVGAPELVRITVGTAAQSAAALDAIAAVYSTGG